MAIKFQINAYKKATFWYAAFDLKSHNASCLGYCATLTVLERFPAYAFHYTLGNGDYKVRAAPKCTTVDFLNARRDSDTCKARTVLKCTPADVRNARRNGDACKALAKVECSLADCRNSVGNCDLRHTLFLQCISQVRRFQYEIP